MDTLTHALSGALLARALVARPAAAAPGGAASGAPARPGAMLGARLGPPVPVWHAVAVGLLAGAFPDSDFVLGWIAELTYLRGHRGVTHSLAMLPLWALALGGLASLAWRRRASWLRYALLCAAAIAIHIAGDWITGFGTMMLAPFSDARFALGSVFIIDLTISGLLLAGLLLSAWRPRSRMPAVIALLAVCGWVGVTVVGQREALAFGHAAAARLGLAGATVGAVARPASPFNWTVFIATDEGYRIAHVNTRRTRPLVAGPDDFFVRRYSAPYQPLAQADFLAVPRFGATDPALARAVWSEPGFATFRWFAEYPALDRIESTASGGTCVWFRDLRFVFPGRTAGPFVTGMCRTAPDAAWTIRSASEMR